MQIFATGWSEGFDGPARRWMVYLQGCNFQCRWCANPESIPQKKLQSNLPHSESSFMGELTPSQLVDKAVKYKPLFGVDGGVSFGGGEPTLQEKDLFDAIEKLKSRDIRAAVETNASTEAAVRLAGLVDWLYCDLKCFSSDQHEKWTGQSNTAVLTNLSLIAQRQEHLIIRIPFVPGLNTSELEMMKIRDFMLQLTEGRDSLDVEILRMHHMGQPKYRAMQLEYPMEDIDPPTLSQAETFSAILSENAKLQIQIAG